MSTPNETIMHITRTMSKPMDVHISLSDETKHQKSNKLQQPVGHTSTGGNNPMVAKEKDGTKRKQQETPAGVKAKTIGPGAKSKERREPESPLPPTMGGNNQQPAMNPTTPDTKNEDVSREHGGPAAVKEVTALKERLAIGNPDAHNGSTSSKPNLSSEERAGEGLFGRNYDPNIEAHAVLTELEETQTLVPNREQDETEDDVLNDITAVEAHLKDDSHAEIAEMPHLQKRKSETETEASPYVPGPNQFATSGSVSAYESDHADDDFKGDYDTVEIITQTDPRDTFEGGTAPQGTATAAPSPLFALMLLRMGPEPFPKPPSQNTSSFVRMFAPAASVSHTSQDCQDKHQIVIHAWPESVYRPHMIAPHHVFLNYCLAQVDILYNKQQLGDILVIIWGVKYCHLTLSSKYKLDTTS
ncbi:hypothetical protein EDD18DRAFT_1109984 [Armillaria luteobubalina]|uniref:Uncharacterized protein n=1 Tax=Armillaria luteobubalina TaxID=153913 RepID=A0AA39TI00_9AGAR|nr:hypothetical protein EDD18DRAFT_1109984 [Armillaria luteobubalina]